VHTAKLNDVVVEAREELGRLDTEVAAVARQIEDMKSIGRITFCPKPLLHLPSSDILDSDSYLHVRQRGWCRRGYHCFDIAVTSCKHMFHPFCLAEAFRESSTCAICGTVLHPDWWLSWGLGPMTLDLRARATDLGMPDLRAAMKKSLKSGLSVDMESPLGMCLVF
jgi:hypothetical protein